MTTTNKPKSMFWGIAIFALIWNAMGVMAYLSQQYMTDEVKALLPEAERELYNNVPAWATAAFAIAVFGGLLGSLALLIRKKWATILFLVSFIGIVVQMIHNFFMSNTMEVYGPGSVIMPLMVLVIGIFLIYYSKKANENGWLK